MLVLPINSALNPVLYTLTTSFFKNQVTFVTFAFNCPDVWLYVPHSGNYRYRTVVTICTVQWSLYVPYSGHYVYYQFNIQQFYVLPTQCIYVFCVDLRTNSDYFTVQH